MNKLFGLILLGVMFAILAVVGLLAMAYVSANNYGVAAESGIEAKYKDNQNVLSNYTAKIKEMAQVPDMYTDDLAKVVQAEMEGRYGENGSGAMMQWFQERQLPFDSTLYQNLQTAMEAGRNEFANNQRQLLDQLRVYENARNSIPQGWFLKMAGFPKKNLEEFKIITLGEVQQKFETGTDDVIDVRK